MKKHLPLLFLFFIFPFLIPNSFAQSQFQVMSRCGGSYWDTIPGITDNDMDGMDDNLEQLLLENFVPAFIHFDDDGCPGPALDGTGDTNLVACRIFPIPQQYTSGNDLDSVKLNPSPIAGDTELTTGLVWYENTVVIFGAILYGKDCGITSHTADVEGFTVTLKYTGADTVSGWRYDTVMGNWHGETVQTTSHEGTACEQTETYPYRSIFAPNGKDTIFPSPDKHGNYLTVAKCNSSFICDPDCNGLIIPKNVKIINIGEENFPLVTDLGVYYAGYAGEDPWSNSGFLSSQGGSVGPLKDKMLKALSNDFIFGQEIDSCYKICDLYSDCFACGDSIYNLCVASCDTVQQGNSPWYSCPPDTSGTTSVNSQIRPLVLGAKSEITVYPNPFKDQLHVFFLGEIAAHELILLNVLGKEVKRFHIKERSFTVQLGALPDGIYFLSIRNSQSIYLRKILKLSQ